MKSRTLNLNALVASGITLEQWLDADEAQQSLWFDQFPGPVVELSKETDEEYSTRISQLN
jgi:hypothetical protein